MLTLQDVQKIIDEIDYRDWYFRVGYFEDSHIYIQIKFHDEGLKLWGGRKWYISTYSTKDEVVQTALKAVLTAVEHEAREAFLYKGFPIFGPHHSIDELVGIAESKRET
jgi:hypothetical protein